MTTSTPSRSEATELDELRQLADDIFTASVEPVLDVQRRGLPFDPRLWSTLADSGLTLLTTPEGAGGGGAGLRELAVVLERSGYHAAPVPVAEHDLLASWLLRSAEMPIHQGPMTAAATTTPLDGNRLVTSLPSVPWVRDSERLVVSGPGYVALLAPEQLTISDRDDVGGQPRGRVDVDVRLSPESVASVEDDLAEQFLLRGALARSLQTCGALNRALELSSAHVTQRVQFGRPLSKFQAVQTLIAGAANATCLAKSASDFAVEVAEVHGFSSQQARFAIAVAKVESCRAATVVARNAHQAHGAIGFTLDHRLRHFTMRALAWRSEFGVAREWQHRLGRMLLDSPGSAWEFVTANDAVT